MASSSKSQPTSGPLHRLVRTLSGNQTTINAQPVSPVLSAQVIPPSVSEELSTSDPSNASSTTESHEPKERALLVDFIDRFKNINLGGKFKKARNGREEPDAVISNTVDLSPSVAPDTDPPTASIDENTSDTLPAGPSTSPDDPAEPTYLARKIQALIDSLSLPSSPTSPTTPRPPPKRDATGRPIPPPNATPIKDSKLIAMLSSATIMNGSSSSSRPSVWSILESLGAPKHESSPAEPEGDGDQDVGVEPEDPSDGGSVFSDGSSLMMYSPLLPTQSSLVELADTELLPVSEPSPGSSSGETDTATGLAAWMGMWPFYAWGGKGGSAEKQEEIVSQPSAGPSYTPSSPDRRAHHSALPDIPESGLDGGVVNGDLPRFQAQGQRVWVPSTTKLSLQAMWWGYRLYLPPPVLDILSDKQIEATKRAAMITSALTWFFSHLPISSLPIAVRPALLLLQTLVPYVGYIGTFISWSWSTIKSYDTGHGVILTATWLLPVALIPGTWEERDFPPASPAPADPPSLPPSNPTPAPAPTPVPPNPSPAPAPVPQPAPPAQPTSPAPPTQPTPPPQTPRPPPTSPLPSTPAPPPPSSPQPPPAPSPPTIPLPPASEPPTPPAPSPPTIPLPDMEPASPVFGVLWKGKERERERRHGEKKEKDRLGKAKAKAIDAIKGLRGGGGDGGAR